MELSQALGIINFTTPECSLSSDLIAEFIQQALTLTDTVITQAKTPSESMIGSLLVWRFSATAR